MIVNCSFDEMRDLVTLQPNPLNYNIHSDKQIDLLAKILKHQGWRKSITVSKRSGFVVCGHGTIKAALKNGWDKAPVDLQDFKSEADEYAHLIADNKIAELAETDTAKLDALVAELPKEFDVTLAALKPITLKPIDTPPTEPKEKPLKECPQCKHKW